MKLSKRELHSMPGTLSDLHGERPEAATQHAPEIAGALLDAHASLLRAASALCSHPPSAYPPAARAAVSRIASVSAMAARDIGVVLVELRRGET